MAANVEEQSCASSICKHEDSPTETARGLSNKLSEIHLSLGILSWINSKRTFDRILNFSNILEYEETVLDAEGRLRNISFLLESWMSPQGIYMLFQEVVY